jgi:hypothetical protein
MVDGSEISTEGILMMDVLPIHGIFHGNPTGKALI